jgi:hypothetical protein
MAQVKIKARRDENKSRREAVSAAAKEYTLAAENLGEVLRLSPEFALRAEGDLQGSRQ